MCGLSLSVIILLPIRIHPSGVLFDELLDNIDVMRIAEGEILQTFRWSVFDDLKVETAKGIINNIDCINSKSPTIPRNWTLPLYVRGQQCPPRQATWDRSRSNSRLNS